MNRLILSILWCLAIVCCVTAAMAQHTANRTALGKLTSPLLTEVSGMTPSARYPSAMWVHNDSGDEARLYLIDSLADLIGTVELQGVPAVDMEDMAWVNIDGVYHLILADIGDNRGRREEIYLYIFEEPKDLGRHQTVSVPRSDIRICTLRYSGRPRDAEAIFIDPLDHTLFLITKREFHSTIYTAPVFRDHSRSDFLLQPQLELPFTFVTAADISRQRNIVLIKNLTSVFFWRVPPGARLMEALNQSPEELVYQAEPQGEALAIDRFEEGYFTLSERPLGLDAYLYFYTF